MTGSVAVELRCHATALFTICGHKRRMSAFLVCFLLEFFVSIVSNLSHVMRKLTFCICENKDADQLRGHREADQRLCFRYIDSMIPLLSKSAFQASSNLL